MEFPQTEPIIIKLLIKLFNSRFESFSSVKIGYATANVQLVMIALRINAMVAVQRRGADCIDVGGHVEASDIDSQNPRSEPGMLTSDYSHLSSEKLFLCSRMKCRGT